MSREEDRVTAALRAIKFSPDGSIFGPESLRDIRDRLARIEQTGCFCAQSPHLNALHDLALVDVPVLLQLVESMRAEEPASD